MLPAMGTPRPILWRTGSVRRPVSLVMVVPDAHGVDWLKPSPYIIAMIRPCTNADVETIYAIINEAAEAYRGVIPADRWHEPYMSQDELRHEIETGVKFWGFEQDGQLLGVMGIQDVQDVTLIRHAYVRTASRSHGIGGKLLAELRAKTSRPILIGTWAAAAWAIRFYEKHGFRQVTPEEKDRLLERYWSISDRQVETSVVLADEKWSSAMTRHVLETHMTAVDSGDLDVIMADYAADAVLLAPEGSYRGHVQIRPVWNKLLMDVFTKDADFTMVREAVEGEVAFIVWSLNSKRIRIMLATDNYLVRAGKIVVQTYAAMEEQK